MPARKGRTCFVPFCKGGYKSSTEKVSLFRAPSDPVRLQEWARNIKRDDKALDSTCVVCSRHFDERYVQRTFKHMVNGESVEFERERPSLTDDAVPTVFPDAPAYLTKPAPKKRKVRDLANNYVPRPKRKALGESTPDLELAERIDLPKAPEPSPHPFSDVTPPSVFCTKIVLTNDPGALCFGWHVRLETGDVLVVKHVTFTECSEPVTAERAETSLCRIYCRNIKVDEFLVANESDALAALKKVDALLLCPGCDVEPLKSGQCTKFGTAYYAHTCCVTTAEGKQCLRCKYTRKLIANQMRRQKQQPKPKFRQRAARKSVQLLRTKRKLAKVQENVEKLRLLNESIASTAFEQKISGLPPKQRTAVRTCFEAASRKSSRGMTYDKMWVLECVLMRMKSPQLYEHIRRHQIMALPSKSCLDKHMQGFKGAFGFNPKVFSALDQKTKDMDEFSVHGGLVFDELKLSENIGVKASGEMTGFVDLGTFTEQDNKTSLSDHGLVIMFQPFQGG